MSNEERRTKRRYAHELYPQPDEWEVRPLEVEVPCLYARAIGMDLRGTGWFANIQPEAGDRTILMIEAHRIALLADALLQGLSGQEAWAWAEERVGDSGEFVYDRAFHYGVDASRIKSYPCGPEPDHHDHDSEPDGRGWITVTRIAGRESDCPDCTEPIETPENEDEE